MATFTSTSTTTKTANSATVAVGEQQPLFDISLDSMGITQQGLTQQEIVQITLSGPALLLTILGIILSINLLQPSHTCTFIALAPIPWFIYNDYRNFLSLGPGGTPATFRGYMRITYLRLFALADPYTAPKATANTKPVTGFYAQSDLKIPHRTGPRPKVAGIAPQRQVSQYGSRAMYLLLRTSLENLAFKHSDKLQTGTSCFEKKGLALFALNIQNDTCRGEICHVHHTDHSMHLNLHPDDAKIVLEQGWGERHPLADGAGKWVPRWVSERLAPKVVPQQFLMIYAPRDRAELEVITHIIEAAAYWVSGEQFTLPIQNVPVVAKETTAA
ncbi:glutamate-1-semialdehyde -aminomutase protein [Rutstroemia sp. NJR-2017a WRK4]|nr:glutamate-1-semialdehyde -aminomutase protein [Rutstroemia sp. NJR-2017a WRK4]PQE14767.1 glutamate-1-semialdehyde -aminomutase protein [Rutstroemia sp. NJR-2017a WRK4]